VEEGADRKALLAERAGVLAGQEAESMTKELLAPEDLMVMVLRFHLFSESLLERLIAQRLPRPDRLLDRGRLTFNQKLLLVSALDLVADGVVQSLRHLNVHSGTSAPYVLAPSRTSYAWAASVRNSRSSSAAERLCSRSRISYHRLSQSSMSGAGSHDPTEGRGQDHVGMVEELYNNQMQRRRTARRSAATDLGVSPTMTEDRMDSKPPAKQVSMPPIGSTAKFFGPTVSTTSTYGPEWFEDAVREAGTSGHSARRREILFAVCATESSLFE
jgi:hypothetical protein